MLCLSLFIPAEGVWGEREFGEGVIVTDETDGFGVTDLGDGFDAGTRFGNPETVSGKNLTI